MNKNVLITGASGLIGTRLTELLHEKGHRIAHLSRTQRSGKAKTFVWNIAKHQIDEEALKSTDAIIHLAGAGIAEKPWTKERKQEILKSRIDSTQLLYNELKKGNHTVKRFVSASGVDVYKIDDHNTITESGKPGTSFLAGVVNEWEKAVDKIASLGIRVVKIRSGFVLSDKGGALTELMRPIKFFIGAPLGSGDQHISWIHLDDLCSIFIKAVEDDRMEGVYNGVAPNPVTNKEFTNVVAKILHRRILLPPIPAFVLKLYLGEMADLVLKGNKISSQKIQRAGFQFKFNKLDDALQDLLG